MWEDFFFFTLQFKKLGINSFFLMRQIFVLSKDSLDQSKVT